MFTAFFFDLDGTLLDTEVLWVEATGLALAEVGHVLSGEELTSLVYGHAWRDIYAELAQRFPGDLPALAALTEIAGRHFHALRAVRDVRIPSSIALLRRLAATHPVAVVSGSTRADIGLHLDLIGVLPLVRFYLGSEDYAPGKPDPACYRLAAERLGVLPARCLVFEDSAAGARAARAAGMACVGLQRAGSPAQDLSAATWIVGDLAECLERGILPIR